MRRRTALVAVLLIGIAVPAASAGTTADRAGTTERVKVLDDYYSPVNLKIKKNDKVKYVWSEDNINTHNVTLADGPKGVKRGCPQKGPDAYSPLISKCNKSASGRSGIKFKKKFDVKGTYDFVCTIHPDVMVMTVRVGR